MKKISFAIVFILLACMQYSVNNRIKNDSWKGIIGGDWDGYGYYAYLPAIFIHHSFDYTKVMDDERKFQPGISEKQISLPFLVYKNGYEDKYYIGVAVLLTPFFLLAYFLSYIFRLDPSGYSFIFQVSVCMAALFYLTVGLIYLRKLLLEYEIPKFIIGLVFLLAFFGTNLFYYATMEVSISHIYSFSIACIFLYFAKRSLNKPELKNLVKMSAAMGMLIIIRPTNLLLFFSIPFLAGNWAATWGFIKNIFRVKNILFMFLSAFAVVGLQFIIWYCETGHFYIWSYQGEGFFFNHPHIADFLFSYRKGWFLYTPLMFVVLVSALLLFIRQNIFRFFCLLFFLSLVIYVLSSWIAWSYGGSFSQRVMVDFYPLFILVFAWLFKTIPSFLFKLLLIAISLFCIHANIIQMFQLRTGMMEVDTMTKEKYWKIFLQTDIAYYGVFESTSPDAQVFDTTHFTEIDCNMENRSADDSMFISSDKQYFFRDGKLQSGKEFHSKANSIHMDEDHQWAMYEDFQATPGDCICATIWKRSADVFGDIAICAKSGKGFYAEGRTIINPADNGWQQIRCKTYIPDDYKEKSFTFYLYYSGNKEVYFDDLAIKIYHKRS